MKAKTHSGAKKRLKITGTGKKRFKKASKRHLLVNKSKRQKGIKELEVAAGDNQKLSRLLPNN